MPRRAPGGFTLLEYEPDLGDALAACDLVLARAGRLGVRAGRGRKARDPRPLSARRRATTSTPTRAWMAESGRRVVIEDAELEPEPSRAPSRSCSPTPGGSTRWRRPPRGARPPDAARRDRR